MRGSGRGGGRRSRPTTGRGGGPPTTTRRRTHPQLGRPKPYEYRDGAPRGGAYRYQHPKRGWGGAEVDDDGYGEPVVVDDLLVAAQYANLSLSSQSVVESPTLLQKEVDDDPIAAATSTFADDENEIDTDRIGDGEDEGDCDDHDVPCENDDDDDQAGRREDDGRALPRGDDNDSDERHPGESEEGESDNNNDDDDDESTVDLEAELARMTEADLEDDDDDEDPGRSRTSAAGHPPRTAHEVAEDDENDSIGVARSPVVAAAATNPSLSLPSAPDRPDPSSGRFWVPMESGSNNMDWRKHFQPCGTIQRKVLTAAASANAAATSSAESTSSTTTTTLIVQADPSHLLEEGNALWIPLDPSADEDMGTPTSGKGAYMAVLGTVTEVFGPVRQPCYRVRVVIPVHSEEAKEYSVSAHLERSVATIDERPTPRVHEPTTAEPDAGGQPLDDAVAAADADTPREGADNVIRDGGAPNSLRPTVSSWKVSKLQFDSWADRQSIVYYRVGSETTIDAHQVWRQSGRGCDASNLWDEEVVDASALDYSDDEQEQQAKQRNKNRNNKHRVDVRRAPHMTSSSFSSGTMERAAEDRAPPPPPPPFHPSPRGSAYHHQPLPVTHQAMYSAHPTPHNPSHPGAMGVHNPQPYPSMAPQGFHSTTVPQPPPTVAAYATTFSGPGLYGPPYAGPWGQSVGAPGPMYSWGTNVAYHSAAQPPPPPPPPPPAAVPPPAEEPDTIYYDYS